MSKQDLIQIRGAREHNLKNINIDLPRGKLIVVTGLSGSGKSSLAFNTIYAEGQRRYVESLSVYARQFLDIMPKPDVESINGLSPAIAVQQKTSSRNPRSTVGTVTEIYDYLRILFVRGGTVFSPETGKPITSQTIFEMSNAVLNLKNGLKILLLAPIVDNRKGEFKNLFYELQKKGFQRFKVNGTIYLAEDLPVFDKNKKHCISVVVDRIIVKNENDPNNTSTEIQNLRDRLIQDFEVITNLTDGLAEVEILPEETDKDDESGNKKDSEKKTNLTFSQHFACPESGFTIKEMSSRLLSFNSPIGMCDKCHGLGSVLEFDTSLIIPDDSLSVLQGAIVPFANDKNITMFLRKLIIKMGYDPVTIFKNLPPKVKDAILFGIKDIEIEITDQYDRKIKSKDGFKGVINVLQERIDLAGKRLNYALSRYRTLSQCNHCDGYRLQKEALALKIGDLHIGQVCNMSIEQAWAWSNRLEEKISNQKLTVVKKVITEIRNRLSFLKDVGLGYLSLSRGAGTLSGGESQRMRLASQIGSGLTGVLYILDEPSIGLHQKDNDRLINTLVTLRDLGNTVIVVEHDKDTILAADHIVDMGPKSGNLGGKVIAQGDINDIVNNPASPTGRFLNGIDKTYAQSCSRKVIKLQPSYLKVIGASKNNLHNIDVTFPLGKFICVTGISGSGKSSLVIDTLGEYLQCFLNNKNTNHISCKNILGVENINKCIKIDQSPIGRSPRSNPATYIGVFDHIRNIFGNLLEAKARGYTASRFSFNVSGGRCEECSGCGVIKVEMHFLADVTVICEKCRGRQYNPETLQIKYKSKSIHDVLMMTVDEATDYFEKFPSILSLLQLLQKVGLGYITLGQKGTTLSGGEAQRIKLAKELGKRRSHLKGSVYILDEPTTGLHFADVKKLLEVLHSFVESGDTIIVIEHNLEVIETADHIIDFGPEGGILGGQVIASGSIAEICKNKKSITGQYLKKHINFTPIKTKLNSSSKS